MLSLPDTKTLQPQMQSGLYTFPSSATGLVKLDLLFEAGSAYQKKKMCASAAAKLATVATPTMDSTSLAEFMDYRGILIETDCQVQQSSITFYFLRRYADDLIPVASGMLAGMSFSDKDFETWKKHRRQEVMSALQKPSSIVRRDFYSSLFGDNHPLGRHAAVNDVDMLTADEVRRFFDERYKPEYMTVVVAGDIDDRLVGLITDNIKMSAGPVARPFLPAKATVPATIHHTVMPDATQTAIRVGRVLPMYWNEQDYAQNMLLTTALGGYFGSRLMSNIRENKGYTYGIYARTQIYRGVILFYVTTEVASGTAQAAIEEVKRELAKLVEEPMTDEELQLVKTVITGDFLRSVDGIFERSARFCDMFSTCVTEQFTDNLREAIATATPQSLQTIAGKLYHPDGMTICTAGV